MSLNALGEIPACVNGVGSNGHGAVYAVSQRTLRREEIEPARSF